MSYLAGSRSVEIGKSSGSVLCLVLGLRSMSSSAATGFNVVVVVVVAVADSVQAKIRKSLIYLLYLVSLLTFSLTL